MIDINSFDVLDYQKHDVDLLNGYFSEIYHRFPMRVHYADTDAGGVVYHANYLNFAERARAAYLRNLGLAEIISHEGEKIQWVVRKVEVNYSKPVFVMDIIEVVSEIHKVKKTSCSVRQYIRKDKQTCVTIDLNMVMVNESLKPVKIPSKLLSIIGSKE